MHVNYRRANSASAQWVLYVTGQWGSYAVTKHLSDATERHHNGPDTERDPASFVVRDSHIIKNPCHVQVDAK